MSSASASRAAPVQQERRAFGRRETDIPASVRYGHRNTAACTIRDISEGGALLEFSGVIELPERFWLTWQDAPSEIVCEVRHARANRVGVQFARPIVIAARSAVVPPSTAIAPQPASRAFQADTAAVSAASLVAEKRRALKAASPPPVQETGTSRFLGPLLAKLQPAAAELLPRDLSKLLSAKKLDALAPDREGDAVTSRPLAPIAVDGQTVESVTLILPFVPAEQVDGPAGVVSLRSIPVPMPRPAWQYRNAAR